MPEYIRAGRSGRFAIAIFMLEALQIGIDLQRLKIVRELSADRVVWGDRDALSLVLQYHWFTAFEPDPRSVIEPSVTIAT